MTTTVSVHAHCASTKEVHIAATDQPTTVLQDGEKADFYAYDRRVISVKEVEKGIPFPMTFGDAIVALKNGAKVARAGWNGKGMWLLLVGGTPEAVLREGTPYANALGPEHVSCEILPHIDMWTTNASGRRAMLPGWLASQSDMLAEDWQIVLG